MVTIQFLILVAFTVSVSVALYHKYTIKSEQPLLVQRRFQQLSQWADTVATAILVLWLFDWMWHLYTNTPIIPAGIVGALANTMIAVSIVQRNASHTFWRVCGYILLTLSAIVLVGSIAGCQSSQKYEDPVQPAGAIKTYVPVPTCGDDLAKSLFIVSDRPKGLPINLLTAADRENYQVVYTAYVETVQILTAYAVALERDRSGAQQQCKAIRQQVDTLNTKTPAIPVQK